MHDMNKAGFVKTLKTVDQELQSSEVYTSPPTVQT